MANREQDKKLYDACENGDLNTAIKLINDGADILYQNSADREMSPLMVALYNRNYEIVNYLIEKSTNKNETVKQTDRVFSWTPLFYAAEYCDSKTTSKIASLTEDLNRKSKGGFTAVDEAVSNNNLPALYSLLR